LQTIERKRDANQSAVIFRLDGWFFQGIGENRFFTEPEAYQNHPLRGNWKGCRDAHIEPGWLLLYRMDGEELQLARTGTHADLFQE